MMPSLRLARPSSPGVLLLAAVLLTGCSAMRPAAPAGPAWSTATAPAPARTAPTTTAEAAPAEASAPGRVEQRLREAAWQWHGTPYRYGGDTRAGIDCSAFVRAVYDETFGLALPRTTAEQVHEGRPVGPAEHVPGDLVFFRPPGRKGRHVGIYLGRGEFVHAGTSTGVTISNLDEPYWREAYWTTRRLLPGGRTLEPALPALPASSATARPARPRTATARSGW